MVLSEPLTMAAKNANLDLDDFEIIDDTRLVVKDGEKQMETHQRSLLRSLPQAKERLEARKGRLGPKEYVLLHMYSDGEDVTCELLLVNGKVLVSDLQAIKRSILTLYHINPETNRIRLLMANKKGEISPPSGGWNSCKIYAWIGEQE
ncbi:hypothetical protein QR680_003989 [Steinernema hermaphroditum]|uniref:Uncharacterized protein n=1 Tax=Steinernema hermaphroditum TaxID=289476 RepID=A0AA39HMA2_9BILA|nr:hypothetical protein QR680_003989 [Steinernema hermaphroditum]